MAISDGSPVNAAASNAAWVSRTIDTSMSGTLTNSNTTESTDKDTGAVILQGGLGVEKNLNIGGNFNAAGSATASNLNGTNTGDVTLNTVGTSPNSTGATLTGQVLNLQPADSSNPGVMSIVAQSFTGDKTFNNNVIVDGNLTVNGTTTTVNSTTLAVTDANVTVNNGGNDTTANGAGLTIDRVSTDGSIVFDDTLASYWKAGLVGSESQIMTTGTAQSVTGVKTHSAKVIFQNLLRGDQTVDAATTGSNASVASTKLNLKLTNASLVSVRDISSPEASELLMITNGTGASITIINDNAASTRIQTGTGSNIPLANGASILLIYDTNSSLWRVIGSSSNFSLTTVGSAPNANAATYNSGTGIFNLEPADGTNPGVLTAGSQTIGGNKTLTGTITASNLSGTNTGDVTLATITGTLAINKGGTGQTTQQTAIDALLPSQSGNSGKFLTTDGATSSWGTSGSGVTSLSAIGATPNANAGTITGSVLNLEPASGTFGGVVTTGTQTFAGNKTFTGTVAASNLSGTNTGDVTVTSFGATPNANGVSLSGQALTLQPADSTNPGGVSTAAQDIGGAKTFKASVTHEIDTKHKSTNANLVTVKAPTGLAASYNFVLPPLVGSIFNQFLTTDGSGNSQFNTVNGHLEISNLAITTAVGSSALTISLLTGNNATPSAADPIRVGFVSSSNGNGNYETVLITSSISVTISNGSTLGQTSSQSSYIWVYLINNSGVAELAVSHSKYNESLRVISTTAEGGAGGADSHTTVYSTTARTNKAFRLIGFLQNTQITAGVWGSNPVKIQLVPSSFGNQSTFINQTHTNLTTVVSGATYLTPAGCTKLIVTMVGGGGGGGGSGTTNGTVGGNGGTTTFGTRSVTGGAGTLRLGGGAAGTGAGSGYTIIYGSSGGVGHSSGVNPTTANGTQLAGGAGADSIFGGGGTSGPAGGGGGVGSQYGAGGGGGGNDNTGASQAGAGGGSGGFYKLLIAQPESSYTYDVGTGGGGGTAGAGSTRPGGAGFQGAIFIEEYYD